MVVSYAVLKVIYFRRHKVRMETGKTGERIYVCTQPAVHILKHEDRQTSGQPALPFIVDVIIDHQ